MHKLLSRGVAVILVTMLLLAFSLDRIIAAEKKTGSVPSTNSMPRLVDVGADKCIPCKMMAPILEELRAEYAGSLEVIFVDVWKKPEEGDKYGVRMIPTQIFYDASGKELYRHLGFMSKEDILKKLQELKIPIRKVQSK